MLTHEEYREKLKYIKARSHVLNLLTIDLPESEEIKRIYEEILEYENHIFSNYVGGC